MHIRLACAFLCLLGGCAGGGTWPDGPVEPPKATLEWKLTRGQKLRYEIIRTMTMVDQGDSIVEKDSVRFTLAVSEIDTDRSATLAGSIDRVTLGSDRDPQVCAGLVGKPFTMRIARNGKVLNVEGWTRAIKDVLKAIDDDGALAQRFHDAGLRQVWQLVFPQLTKDPVARNGQWSTITRYSFGPPGTLHLENQLTLPQLNPGTGIAVIATLGREMRGDEESDATLQKDAKVEGRADWSLVDGLLMSSTIKLPMALPGRGGDVFALTLDVELKRLPLDPDTKN